jgi:hypothetical protein
MADNLIDELLARLESPEPLNGDAFGMLRDLAHLVNRDGQRDNSDPRIQRLVLRALDRREQFSQIGFVLDALVRQRGLYPYLSQNELGFGASVALEIHRPENLVDVVFHSAQASVYQQLLAGNNVILSAPTSFGKSLIIDAMIATNRYHNIVVVVPTIALIDETRRRLGEKFRGVFKMITHASQARADRNIFVLTQERVIDFPPFDGLDFFVIDEFYKLDPRQDSERAMLLNQALYRLLKSGAQFYMLGPNIRELPARLPDRFKATFISTDYATVVSELHRIHATQADKLEKLVNLCRELTEPTLIYCASPASARRVAAALAAAGLGSESTEGSEAGDWAAEHYHPDWVFARAIRRGIGVHHGRVPRALQQYCVRAFNDGILRFLVCTSTLIEGVNTKAKNIVVYDNKISRRKYDYFTFNNIRGRSGRMFQHFVGQVYLFNDPPAEDFPVVDLPLFTQGEQTPESLLIQMGTEDLTPRSRQRLESVEAQNLLPMDTLRANRGIDPTAQLQLATELERNAAGYHSKLSWNQMPDAAQLLTCCQLIWNYLIPDTGMRATVSSGEQLNYRLNRFRLNHSIRRLILQELASQESPDADLAVESVLEFIRYWPTFAFPRLLMALDGIQRVIYQRAGLRPGEYSMFATALENSFLPAGLAALDEYGIPIEVARKNARALGQPTALDEALAAVKSVDLAQLDLTPFERTLVSDTRKSL